MRGCSTRMGTATFWPFANPSVQAYDPAFAYEVAVIVREGLHRMLENGENLVYYLTIMNESYCHAGHARRRGSGHSQGHV